MRSRHIPVARILLAAGLAAAIGGAALAQTVGAGGATAAAPAEADKALFESSCSGCHDLNQATGQRHDAAEWATVVEQMIGYGATLSPADADRITRYLAAHYSKQGSSAAAPN